MIFLEEGKYRGKRLPDVTRCGGTNEGYGEEPA